MKSIAIIIGLIVGGMGFAAFGQSAVVDDHPPYPMLGSQFTRPNLSQGERKAFEMRAQQKLGDLADYLGLVGSASLDGQLRKKAMGMCLDLFRDEGATFAMILPDCRNPSLGPIKEYLGILANSKKYETLKVTLSDVHLVDPATESDDGGYRGSLAFRIDADFRKCDISKCLRGFEGEIGFELLRIPKKFGDKEKMVWETKLAGVR